MVFILQYVLFNWIFDDLETLSTIILGGHKLINVTKKILTNYIMLGVWYKPTAHNVQRIAKDVQLQKIE